MSERFDKLLDVFGTPQNGYVDEDSIDGRLFYVWDALNKIAAETENSDDITGEHVHDVAEGAMELVDEVRASLGRVASVQQVGWWGADGALWPLDGEERPGDEPVWRRVVGNEREGWDR